MTDKLYIFFDTETTGVPQNYKAPTTDTRNWPRLVQLGWILMDSEGNKLSQKDYIIRPEGFTISVDASRIHGITNARALEEGRALPDVINEFMSDFDQATFIVGHNVDFDKKIVGAELVRLHRQDIMNSKRTYCTMQASTNFCRIPGRYGYKWPKLQELYFRHTDICLKAHEHVAPSMRSCVYRGFSLIPNLTINQFSNEFKQGESDLEAQGLPRALCPVLPSFINVDATRIYKDKQGMCHISMKFTGGSKEYDEKMNNENFMAFKNDDLTKEEVIAKYHKSRIEAYISREFSRPDKRSATASLIENTIFSYMKLYASSAYVPWD